MATTVIFNDIQIGRKFKTPANVTYQKRSVKTAKPILDSKGNIIANGLETAGFYNSKVRLELI